ncbi:MGMT family protein [Brevundimonas denitrificans]|uniref:MGMT family protein n=1 Tax=Brevundimonas denitrificans TaxID=1443434 RepID=UPI00352DE015
MASWRRASARPRRCGPWAWPTGPTPWASSCPCHRVVGSSGKLTGYAGGLERKKWLLEHEGALKV